MRDQGTPIRRAAQAQLASELLKLRTTRTAPGLMAAMLGLIVTAVALHGYGVPAAELNTPADQLSLLVGWGEVIGALFAGLLGAVALTGEIRHGTIRPTLLVTPRRNRVMGAKCVAAGLFGLGYGVAATGAALVAGQVALGLRGIDVVLDAGDSVRFVAGGAAAAALWAMVGLGVGALVRNQVPTVVGLLVWVLFVEGILIDSAPTIGRLAPGALGQSLSGLRPDSLLAPALGGLLLTLFTAGAVLVGTAATTRRDLL